MHTRGGLSRASLIKRVVLFDPWRRRGVFGGWFLVDETTPHGKK